MSGFSELQLRDVFLRLSNHELVWIKFFRGRGKIHGRHVSGKSRVGDGKALMLSTEEESEQSSLIHERTPGRMDTILTWCLSLSWWPCARPHPKLSQKFSAVPAAKQAFPLSQRSCALRPQFDVLFFSESIHCFPDLLATRKAWCCQIAYDLCISDSYLERPRALSKRPDQVQFPVATWQ